MITLDYRQLKAEPGLDHYKGRSWNCHTALVTTAHALLTTERQNPNPRQRGSHSPTRSATFMLLFACGTGHCHTCYRLIDLIDLPLPHTQKSAKVLSSGQLYRLGRDKSPTRNGLAHPP